MISPLELVANGLNTVSIGLAGRNNIHTWWTGILGCGAFGVLFWGSQLYADATLQVLFVASGMVGWWRWANGRVGVVKPVRATPLAALLALAGAVALVTGTYGFWLGRSTNAYAPYADSFVLAASCAGQLLLVERRVESWWCWLAVNTVAVPLFASRGLLLTAVLYAVYWVNAVVSLGHWRRLVRDG